MKLDYRILLNSSAIYVCGKNRAYVHTTDRRALNRMKAAAAATAALVPSLVMPLSVTVRAFSMTEDTGSSQITIIDDNGNITFPQQGDVILCDEETGEGILVEGNQEIVVGTVMDPNNELDQGDILPLEEAIEMIGTLHEEQQTTGKDEGIDEDATTVGEIRYVKTLRGRSCKRESNAWPFG